MAQLVVVVEILVAERDPEYALTHQRPNFMFDQIRTPVIREAAGEPINQLYRAVRGTQQQAASITRHRATVERSDH